MTDPYDYQPGTYYHVWRTTLGDFCALTPDARGELNHIVLTTLTEGVRIHRIRLFGVTVLSDRYDLILQDNPKVVRLPQFMAWLNRTLTHRINKAFGLCGSVWAPGSYGKERILDVEGFLEGLADLILSPVSEGWVDDYREWPGLGTHVAHLGALLRRFTVQTSNEPESRELRLDRPHWFCDTQSYQRRLSEVLQTKLRERQEQVKAENKCSRSVEWIQSQSRRARADRNKDRGLSEPRTPTPPPQGRRGVLCLNEALVEAHLAKRKVWRARYLRSFRAWKRGRRRTRFPAGTFQMRVVHNARCEPFGDP